MIRHYTYVVIGGGIAGVTCVETLSALDQKSRILLLTGSENVETASDPINITKSLVVFNVEEEEARKFSEKYENVEVLKDQVTRLDYSRKIVETAKNENISFTKLCICTGARPNVIFPSNPNVIGIRDTKSVEKLERKLKSARRILIVGNGGIATDLVYQVNSVEKIWVVKDDFVCRTFFDEGAGYFLRMSRMYETAEAANLDDEVQVTKKVKYTEAIATRYSVAPNVAGGPEWYKYYDMTGIGERNSIIVEFNTAVTNIIDGSGNWPATVYLTNGKHYHVDLIVSATGVTPNSDVFKIGNEDLKIAKDGGILVDEKLETSLPDVFAAGDVCTAGWEVAEHWFQMRIWTQARQMGEYSAKSMVASLHNIELEKDFHFQIFSHVTKLFGFKVILLGLFNAQKFIDEYELLLKRRKKKEYVKLVLKDGKMHGALLIGETGLEEFCENCIMNQIDVTPFGDDILYPNFDIENYGDSRSSGG